MALWFECKVRYDKRQEDGSTKKVNEPYLVDALSFTEAESRIINEMKPLIGGEYSISSEKKTKISEIFFNEGCDRYYLVKVNFMSFDENKGVEKKTVNQILVQASDFQDAVDRFVKGMEGSMADYEIASITETMIMDVFTADLSAED